MDVGMPASSTATSRGSACVVWLTDRKKGNFHSRLGKRVRKEHLWSWNSLPGLFIITSLPCGQFSTVEQPEGREQGCFSPLSIFLPSFPFLTLPRHIYKKTRISGSLPLKWKRKREKIIKVSGGSYTGILIRTKLSDVKKVQKNIMDRFNVKKYPHLQFSLLSFPHQSHPMKRNHTRGGKKYFIALFVFFYTCSLPSGGKGKYIRQGRRLKLISSFFITFFIFRLYEPNTHIIFTCANSVLSVHLIARVWVFVCGATMKTIPPTNST